jgi:splicing factor 45
MAKHGHVKGQGLGASGSGISQPLVMERVKAPKAPKAPKGTEIEAPKGAKGMGIGGKAMGRLVNANAEEKNRAELEKYGESSRIVVLTNMVGVEDVDENLQTEIGMLVICPLKSLKPTLSIGEECSKHGVVERVLVHVMHPSPADLGENVRIFVQFSGPAGAWKAVRELDGRFFGGRIVRARYFDEQRFARRDTNTPL